MASTMRLSELEPEGVADDSLEDTGDYAEVPEEERRDEDQPEPNEDEGNNDFEDVLDGEVVELSTAEEDA